MPNLSRRSFIRYSGGLMTLSVAEIPSVFAPMSPKLSFSTLGCPDWTLDQVIDFAVAHKYQGIEIRGIQRKLNLSESPHFNSPAALAETKKKVADKGQKIVALGSSSTMHFPEGPERDKAMDEASRFIEIAHSLGCPYIRVFPNNLPKDQDKEKTLEIIAQNLSAVGAKAKGSGVRMLLETHGDVVHSPDIEKVMNMAQNQEDIGLVWDLANMWSITKEPPAEVYGRLKKWIRHTHLKDLEFIDGKIHYTLFTEGVVPVFEGIDLLAKNKFDGFYSCECEKLWHPEIAEPEIALAQYPLVMREHLAKLK